MITDLGAEEGGNGFTFQTYNAHDMLGAIRRALALYNDRPAWKSALKNAMACDFSWERSAKEYMALFERLESSY